MPAVNHLRSIRQGIEETTGIDLPFNSLATTIALPAAIRDRLVEELPALEKDDTTNPTRRTRLLNPPSSGAIAAAKAVEGNGIAPHTANEGEGVATDVPFWSWAAAAANCESKCRRQRSLMLDTSGTLAKDRAIYYKWLKSIPHFSALDMGDNGNVIAVTHDGDFDTANMSGYNMPPGFVRENTGIITDHHDVALPDRMAEWRHGAPRTVSPDGRYGHDSQYGHEPAATSAVAAVQAANAADHSMRGQLSTAERLNRSLNQTIQRSALQITRGTA